MNLEFHIHVQCAPLQVTSYATQSIVTISMIVKFLNEWKRFETLIGFSASL